MSLPRQILPASTYLLTRRCTQRLHLLTPDAFVETAFGYLFAAAAKRYGIEIHAAICLSNHYHAVVTDPRGRLPRFLMWFHRLVAVVVNVYRGRWESLWSSDKASVVRLESPDDVLDKMIYVLSNATAAGLVASASEWPGFRADPAALLHPKGVEYRRPDLYFDVGGKTPETARLKLVKPPGFDHLTDEQFVALVQERLAAEEKRVRDRRAAEGKEVAGPEEVMRTDWRSSANSPAPRRNRSPHIAARDPSVRCRAIERLRRFRSDYQNARQRWRRGGRRTIFPAGTYRLRVECGVRCHPPPWSLCGLAS